ncbi:TetR/AcrR family transcriptional regulator [Prauserella muralis]|uniref:TetR family transcriptional regulator n=1 Tax=Prauserella muralis TaxID=588067 RepID=A0A2V4APC2_9PSEU|nr:TetR/AcrR family transcriptional regulator [Prauserella muralis]PXY22556.1 TetR family transcriptional regulator [Prauserella muralis]TWE28245.1 TetR family transcriptional regulator [Prauserella muralis]
MTTAKGTGRRAEKARQTRQRMLGAAHELFVDQGYGATTLQHIADRAGVAVQTIYFTFGNKRSLLKELVDVTIAGDDEPLATMERPWFRQALATETAQEHLRAHVAGARAILHRVGPIMTVLANAAATDPEVAALWPQEPDPRFVVQRTAAASLMSKPGARTGVSVDHAADVLYGLLGTEVYQIMVRERGWSPERWEDWTLRMLRHELCAD